MGSRGKVRQAREGEIGLRDFWKSGLVLTCSGEQDFPCVGEGPPQQCLSGQHSRKWQG